MLAPTDPVFGAGLERMPARRATGPARREPTVDGVRETGASGATALAHRQRVADATAAWVEAWLHGNAQPRVVLTALQHLATRAEGDVVACAAVACGRRVVASIPFGSVQPDAAW